MDHRKLGGFGYVGWLCSALWPLRVGVGGVFFFLFDLDLNAQPWLTATGSSDVDPHPTHILCIK